MTDKEIIKALACCGNSKGCTMGECPYNNVDNMCMEVLMLDALDLINLQQAEIERLTAEKLQVIVSLNNCGDSFMVKDAKTIRTEAIKEFAERVKDIIDEPLQIEGRIIDRMLDKIDTLVKEMTEGQK